MPQTGYTPQYSASPDADQTSSSGPPSRPQKVQVQHDVRAGGFDAPAAPAILVGTVGLQDQDGHIQVSPAARCEVSSSSSPSPQVPRRLAFGSGGDRVASSSQAQVPRGSGEGPPQGWTLLLARLVEGPPQGWTLLAVCVCTLGTVVRALCCMVELV